MKHKKILILLAVVISLTVVFATPGSEDDPLVSVSYLETKLNALKSELVTMLQEHQNSQTTPEENSTVASQESTTQVFEALQFAPGSQIVFGASTEFIIRRGTATLIDPDLNNMPDLTSGIDIEKDQVIPLNHHMLCPRRDGRGLTVADDSDPFWIMIKGDYIVIK